MTVGEHVYMVTGSLVPPSCALRCVESKTGKELYRYGTGNAIYAPPTTYMIDGRQWVVMPSGATLTAFALPR